MSGVDHLVEREHERTRVGVRLEERRITRGEQRQRVTPVPANDLVGWQREHLASHGNERREVPSG